MKLRKDIKPFKELMDSAIDESINESYANYGGTNSLGSVQGSKGSKYTPANVQKAPPLRTNNSGIMMGQDDFETKSPQPMIYPFESIFTELVDLYVRLQSMTATLEEAKEMATLTDAKKKSVDESSKELSRLTARLEKVIHNIEEVTV